MPKTSYSFFQIIAETLSEDYLQTSTIRIGIKCVEFATNQETAICHVWLRYAGKLYTFHLNKTGCFLHCNSATVLYIARLVNIKSQNFLIVTINLCFSAIVAASIEDQQVYAQMIC